MIRALPAILAIALTVFCLIDVGMTPASEQVRNLPRWAWILVILLFPFFGPIAWLVAGRPKSPARRPVERGFGPPSPAPDDDPAFLAELERRRQQSEREKLQKWQADLEARERDIDKQNQKRRASGEESGPDQPS